MDFTDHQQPLFSNMRLPVFWEDKPAAWFALAESRFRLHGVAREQARFDLLMSSLTKDSVSRVLDIVECPPLHQPYSVLKERLLASHQLTDYQRIAQLHQMPALGGRKPSELLSAMLELCPRGHESSIFFTHLYLERLPAKLRIMLGEDDHQDPRGLAEKADKLWALHGQESNLLAAVDSVDQPTVAAVSARGRQGHKPASGGRGGRGGAAAAGSQLPPPLKPVDLARIQAGLCFYHWTFGDKANKCVQPCNWGN